MKPEFNNAAFLKKQRLLIVSPHADDEVIGSGGLAARIKDAGGRVFVVIFSIGDVMHTTGTSKVTQMSQRESELNAAMKTIGADDWEILFRDSRVHLRLDSMPRAEITGYIEKKARLSTDNVKPTIIVLPASSFNQDHEAIFKAGITACRPHLPSQKAFQNFVLIADAPQLAWSPPPFYRPNLYITLSKGQLQRKLNAYSCYKSQVRPDPSHASVKALKMLAEMRGREISTYYAEAYECYRFVL